MQNTREELPDSAGSAGYGSFRRRHTARYYMQRVQESLTTRVSKLVCAIFLTLLFIIGMVTFILWISLRPHRPRIHIRDFSIPGLAQANGSENARVVFNATTRNPNQSIGIYYDAFQATLYYADQSIGGTPLLFPFYQPPKNTTTIAGVLSGATLTVNNQLWMQFQSESGRSQRSVIFRLDIASTIRFKVSTWNSKRHRLHARCDVGVGPDGSILAGYRDRRCPVYFT